MRDITILIPYRNAPDALARLLRTLPTEIPVIVVDDLSDAPPPVRPGQCTLIRRRTRGYFSGAVNTGLAACDTDVLVLNQDAWLEGDAWQTFIAEHRDAAIAGNAVTGHPAWPRGYVDGVFMYMSRKAIDAIGGLNERDWPLWGNSAEWQARACRAGFTAVPADVPGLMHDRTGRHGSSIAAFVATDPAHADWARRTPPMISVIMACYNYGRYLPDAIASLRGGMTSLGPHPGQTFAGWECLIVDDCSTDDTPQIAKGLADDWQGIRYIRLAENAGTAGAYNAGIKASHGRYFMVLSADDMLEPDALDHMYRIVEDDPGAVVYTDLQLFGDGKRGKVWEMREYDFEALLERNHVPAGIMASKSAWRAVGGYPAAFRHGREDWAMAVALGRAGYCGVHLPEPLYLYRRAGQNRSATNGTAEWRRTFVQQMRETFPDLYEGERPMGCCGSAKRPARLAQQAPRGVRMNAVRVGENGMTLIEYIGGNIGKQSWYGPVTSIRYEFGGSKKIGYVDDRDLDAMLDVVQGRKPVFQRHVRAAAPPVQMAEPETVAIAEAPMAPVIVPGVTVDIVMETGAPEPTLAPIYTEPTATPVVAEPEEADAMATTLAAVAKPKRKRSKKT